MFVLLEHDAPDGLHWDLMIARPSRERLATWRLAANPLAGAFPIAAERIADHRRAYLDYEGEVSGRRGHVRRLDRGPARIESDRPPLTINLAGTALRGRYLLEEHGGTLRLRPAGHQEP